MTEVNNKLNNDSTEAPEHIAFGEGTNPFVALLAMRAAAKVDVSDAKNETERNQRRTKAFVATWKVGHQCRWCDFETDDPTRLSLDHRDPDEKEAQGRTKSDETRALNYSWPLARVVQEVAKCDVVCTACHYAVTLIRDGLPLPDWASASDRLEAQYVELWLERRRDTWERGLVSGATRKPAP